MDGDPEEVIQILNEEFEILDTALAPWEIKHEVEQHSKETKSGSEDLQTHEAHKIQLTILPARLEGKKLAVKVVEENNRLVPIQFLPRLTLNFSFVLDPDNIGEYPMNAAPDYQIEGFFAKNASEINQELEKLFTRRCPCLFNWFNFAKDELFADPDNFDEYNPQLFSKMESYDGILTVQTSSELLTLQDELFETARLRAQSEPVHCMICFTQMENVEGLKIFR